MDIDITMITCDMEDVQQAKNDYYQILDRCQEVTPAFAAAKITMVRRSC